MISYVPVGDKHFAWHTTALGFLTFSGRQIFDSWEDFTSCVDHQVVLSEFKSLIPVESWKRKYALYIDGICTGVAFTDGYRNRKNGSHAHAFIIHEDGTVSVDERHVRGLNWRLEEQQ